MFNSAFTVVKNLSGLQLSYRRSFTDFFVSPTFKQYSDRVFQGGFINMSDNASSDLEDQLDLKYEDIHAKWIINPGDRDMLHLSFFKNLNKVDYNTEVNTDAFQTQDRLSMDNVGLGMNWQHRWSPALQSTFKGSWSDSEYDYQFELGDETVPNAKESNVNFISEKLITLTNSWIPSNRFELVLGYQLSIKDLDYTLDYAYPFNQSFFALRCG